MQYIRVRTYFLLLHYTFPYFQQHSRELVFNFDLGTHSRFNYYPIFPYVARGSIIFWNHLLRLLHKKTSHVVSQLLPLASIGTGNNTKTQPRCGLRLQEVSNLTEHEAAFKVIFHRLFPSSESSMTKESRNGKYSMLEGSQTCVTGCRAARKRD